jgi:hypothetical protein
MLPGLPYTMQFLARARQQESLLVDQCDTFARFELEPDNLPGMAELSFDALTRHYGEPNSILIFDENPVPLARHWLSSEVG